VFVHDSSCFDASWVHPGTGSAALQEYVVQTAPLSAGVEGISAESISRYLDAYVDLGFERWVDEYFQGTMFLTEILKSVFRFYTRTQGPIIRKGLKMIVAYSLTANMAIVRGLPEGLSHHGKINDPSSRWFGKTIAPVMIAAQIKQALSMMWRELMKEVLEELSTLFASVYSRDKLKNWHTIFILAVEVLALWEMILFDSHYRQPDEDEANRFMHEMESTPVGVIVGLFAAISHQLPSFLEWDSREHHHLLRSDLAVCDSMTEMRQHVSHYEGYLKTRGQAKYLRSDFDCFSNKFLSRLVIRAN